MGVKYTGVGKFAIFDRSRRVSRKRYEIGPWLLCITCRNSQVADRSVSVPMTLSDFETGREGSLFLGNLRKYTRMNDQICRGSSGGEMHVSRGQARRDSKR